MHDSPWHDVHLAPANIHAAVPEVDAKLSVKHDESLVRFLMIMPDEVAFEFDELELMVVHLCNDPRRPQILDQRQLVAKSDRVVASCSSCTLPVCGIVHETAP